MTKRPLPRRRIRAYGAYHPGAVNRRGVADLTVLTAPNTGPRTRPASPVLLLMNRDWGRPPPYP